jgi:hypothetical protein
LGIPKARIFVCLRFWLKPPARASLPSKSIRKQKTGITHDHMHKEFEMLSVPSAFDLEGTISPVHWRWQWRYWSLTVEQCTISVQHCLKPMPNRQMLPQELGLASRPQKLIGSK